METSFIRSVLFGWLTIIILLFLSLTTLAFIIRFTTITETTAQYIATAIAFFTLFSAGLIAGLKGKSKGLMLGLCTGGGFTLLTFLVQFLGYNDLFSLKQTIFHLGYLATSIIGSIIGVNMGQLTKAT